MGHGKPPKRLLWGPPWRVAGLHDVKQVTENVCRGVAGRIESIESGQNIGLDIFHCRRKALELCQSMSLHSLPGHRKGPRDGVRNQMERMQSWLTFTRRCGDMTVGGNLPSGQHLTPKGTHGCLSCKIPLASGHDNSGTSAAKGARHEELELPSPSR